MVAQRERALPADERAAQARAAWEAERALLLTRNVEALERNFALQERVADVEYLREKCFFALVLALKLSEAAKGAACNVDAAALWDEAKSAVPPRQWEAWIQKRATARPN